MMLCACEGKAVRLPGTESGVCGLQEMGSSHTS